MWHVSYDDTPFSNFRIRAICKNPYDNPEPHVETTHVDGMDGDLHFYYGEFQNVTAEYLCLVDGDFDVAYKAFRSWIFGKQGYKRLEDDTYPEHYRMAALLSAPTINKTHDAFNITFSCRPQRFLKSGDTAVPFASSGSIYNPTQCESKPLIRVRGTGALKIGDETITINSNSDYIDLDCDLQDAYQGTTNKNGDITLSSGDFFTLEPGLNGIVLASGMSIELTPRWYEL